jgi:hypothetical protein
MMNSVVKLSDYRASWKAAAEQQHDVEELASMAYSAVLD